MIYTIINEKNKIDGVFERSNIMSDEMNKDIMKVETGTYAENDMHEIQQGVNQEVEQEVNQEVIMEATPVVSPEMNLGMNLGMNQSIYQESQQTVNFTNPDMDNNGKIKKIKVKKSSGAGKRFIKKSLAVVCSAAVFGLVAGAAFQVIENINEKDRSTKQSAVSMQPLNEFEDYGDNSSTNSSQDGAVVSTNTNVTATDVSGVVENAMPAIVAINSTATMTEYDFFGRQVENEVSGSGSGIIIGQSDEEILIVTNNHVVADATAVEIVFVDGTKSLATIKGTEPSSDLAVVSVNIKDLSEDTMSKIRVATLGDSKTLKTGEMAIAIGNALGYGQSVTVGYISALDRDVTVEDVSLNLIQTDAAINPGNSGGALLNAKGEIIGINSVKYADTNVEGIGYAIPISEAVPIINDLMNREELKEEDMGYLGIAGKNVEESYANAFGMPVGIYISEVSAGTPAEEAGLHKGDIIVGINSKTLETMQDLSNTLSYTRGGTTVTVNLKVLENGQYIDKNVDVTLGFRNTAE
jgi:serine protease Do